MQTTVSGSNRSHVTASQLPVIDNIVSSSWDVMEHPVPFSNTNSDLSGESGIRSDNDNNIASYVRSLQHRGDLMAAIASEFEQQAQMSLSQRGSSHETPSQTSQHSPQQHMSNERDPVYLNNQPFSNQDNDMNQQTSYLPPPANYMDTLTLENSEVSNASANSQIADSRLHPPDDHNDHSRVRQNRVSQLRHTIASNNRQTQVRSLSEQGYAESDNRNDSSAFVRHGRRARGSQRIDPENTQDTTANRFYLEAQHPAFPTPPPVATYENDLHQKSLLDLMTRGFRTFTTEMADVIIDKLKIENESLARQVGKEVKEATDKEMKQLRDKLEKSEARTKQLESQNIELRDSQAKERDQSKKDVEKEILKRAKVFQEQSAIITKLEGDLHKVQNTQKEREKMWRKAEVKAKTEEQKRVKLEEEYTAKIKEMQKQLDKVKGDLLVQKSMRRLQTRDSGDRVSSGRLISHHGGYKKHMVHPKHVPYDEGDP